MNIEYRSLAGELRAGTKGSARTLHGYAAVYNQRSQPIMGEFFEIVKPGAFARAVKGDDDVRFLVDHDSGRVLGRSKAGTLTLRDDQHGLGFELAVPDTTEGRDLLVSVDRGDISQMSFGFRTIADDWRTERRDDGTTVDIRELRAVELFDVSAVAYPAYEGTEVLARSANDVIRNKRAADQRAIAEAMRRQAWLRKAEADW